jgi:predicted nucleotidyltransferase
VIEKKLDEMVRRLRDGGGDNVKSIVLFGSAVSGEFAAEHSNLNLLCIVENAGLSALEDLHAAAEWWVRDGYPAPLVFTLEELHRSADIFAIELLDIRAHRRILFGADLFENFDVPTWLHRLQVERELRTNWVRLRRAVLAAPRRNRALLAIMVDSVSSFAVLFQHALLGMGEPSAQSRRDAIQRLSAMVGGDATPMTTILDYREGKRALRDIDVEATLHGYLELVGMVTNEVDRRFEQRR